MSRAPRVLIVAEHASARFGGEAALALHHFRVLRARASAVWLLTHARTRGELRELYGDDPAIVYIEDTAWQRLLWRAGTHLPDQVAYFTSGFLSRLATQFAQRKWVRRLVREHGVNVIHQPMPVSPREPSALFGFGVPVLIGPMNGGMDYPPAFARGRSGAERALLAMARASAALLNLVLPGKRQAWALLVANERTRKALPAGVCRRVIDMAENGVDLQVWTSPPVSTPNAALKLIYVGRLVELKAVDLLLHALARSRVAVTLQVVGDGDERAALQALALELGLEASVEFLGWRSQAECARLLREADALVLPSLRECGGAVVLEAMACAKPVIATAWGGPLDYLDASCGELVEPSGRPELVAGFARSIERLAGDPALRRRMGEAGLAKVRRDYDWERKVDRMLALYDRALAVPP